MTSLLVLALLAEPALADVLADLNHEVQRAQQVVSIMKARAERRPPPPLHLREAPTGDGRLWLLQADYGEPQMRGRSVPTPLSGPPPLVRPESTMRFAVVPLVNLGGQASMQVEVCVGVKCHVPEWPWQCRPNGYCSVQGPARDLLGPEAGERIITFSIRASQGLDEAAWALAAAPSP